MTSDRIRSWCAWSRELVLAYIEELARTQVGAAPLRELILDYPMRPAKGLRPAVCLAASRALGAAAEAALPSAAAFELLHNAFLIHDDVEDESLFRRGEPTLQRAHGPAIAMNVADGMLALALAPLLDNIGVIGLGPALEVLERVRRTVLITVEGQATELGWIRTNTWQFGGGYRDAYERMVIAKTAHYSFIAPIEVGATIGEADEGLRRALADCAEHLGVAFQITDDLLNLRDDLGGYGKEACGDLWEGKRTLMLLHALHVAGDDDDGRAALELLARPRPIHDEADARRRELAIQLHAGGHLDAVALEALLAASGDGRDRPAKTADEVAGLRAFIEDRGGIRYACEVAREHALAAASILERCESGLAAGEAREFLFDLTQFVIERLQ